jgi:preprotein translocase subunit SecG
MIFLTVLIVIIAILLILVVLTQNPKGGGVSQFTGGSTQLMGVKKTGDLLEKLTWGFAIALIVLTVTTNIILKPDTLEQDEEEEQQTEQTQSQKPTQQNAPKDKK